MSGSRIISFELALGIVAILPIPWTCVTTSPLSWSLLRWWSSTAFFHSALGPTCAIVRIATSKVISLETSASTNCETPHSRLEQKSKDQNTRYRLPHPLVWSFYPQHYLPPLIPHPLLNKGPLFVCNPTLLQTSRLLRFPTSFPEPCHSVRFRLQMHSNPTTLLSPGPFLSPPWASTSPSPNSTGPKHAHLSDQNYKHQYSLPTRDFASPSHSRLSPFTFTNRERKDHTARTNPPY